MYVYILISLLSHSTDNILGRFEDEEGCVRAAEIRENVECVGTWAESV